MRLYLRAVSTSFAAFPDVVRDGLFDVNVLAGLHRPDRGQRVPVVGGGDRDRVDLFVFEDAAHVGVDLRPLAGLLKNHGGGLFRAPAIDIDKRGDLDIGHGKNLFDMRRPARSDADDGDAYAIVGAAQDWEAAAAVTQEIDVSS